MKDYTMPITLIKILADGAYHSGESLGKLFGISRAAINKHIRTVKSLGLDLETTTGKGYRLKKPINFLDQNKISKYLPERKIHCFLIVDSTNQFILENMGFFSPGDICVTECQYKGRGRNGKKWHSPFGQNLYMSMYWQLDRRQASLKGLNLVVSVIVAETLRSVGVKNVHLKWPNDIYLNKKRLGGVLVESQGNGHAVNLIIGVGINISMDFYNLEFIDQKTTNLNSRGVRVDRNFLTIEISKKLTSGMRLFEKNGLKPFIERWSKLDGLINRKVRLTVKGNEKLGLFLGVNEDGAMLFEQSGINYKYFDSDTTLRKFSIKNPNK